MRLYVVKVKRLRDGFTQYSAGSVHMSMAEEAATDMVVELGKRCGLELKPRGSRCWSNGTVEVAIESKKAPFKISWTREEWMKAKL